jgi:hypothetical protein
VSALWGSPDNAWDVLLGIALGLLAGLLVEYLTAERPPPPPDELGHQVDHDKWAVIAAAEAIAREAAADAAG